MSFSIYRQISSILFIFLKPQTKYFLENSIIFCKNKGDDGESQRDDRSKDDNKSEKRKDSKGDRYKSNKTRKT